MMSTRPLVGQQRWFPWRLTALLLATLLFSACGYKGPVRPKLEAIPAAVTDLQLQQRGNGLLLSWRIPTSNADGSPLTNLQGFKVFRMLFDPSSDCPDCRDTSSLLATIPLDFPAPAQRYSDRMFLSDRDILTNQGYFYRIEPVNTDRQTGMAATVRIVLSQVPAAPTELTGEGMDRQVRLQWQAVTGAAGYAVYRTRPGQPFPPWPLPRGIVAEPRFDDFAVENGSDYLYAVRTLAGGETPEAQSELSATLQIRPTPLR